MLPAGWNVGNDGYSLMYQSADSAESSTLILKVICFDDQMLLHLLVRYLGSDKSCVHGIIIAIALLVKFFDLLY
jgi:hypothetical protein